MGLFNFMKISPFTKFASAGRLLFLASTGTTWINLNPVCSVTISILYLFPSVLSDLMGLDIEIVRRIVKL